MNDTLFDLPQTLAPGTEPNPCVRLYGQGPEGKTCKTCTLLANRFGYYKCTLRKLTKGAGTDHRVRWKACARYTETEPVCSQCGATKEEASVKYHLETGRAYCQPCFQRITK